VTDPLKRMDEACKEISTADQDVNELAATLWKLSINYFKDVRHQALMSFWMALIAAVIGIGLFITALLLMMSGRLTSPKLSLIASLNIEIVSAIGFYLYARTSHQFAAFHACLERANRFLLTNTMCEKLDDKRLRDRTRSELIQIVANAPLLSVDMVEHGEPGKLIKPELTAEAMGDD
jgi:hypothetical protein